MTPYMKPSKATKAGLAAPPQITRRYEPVIAGRDYGYGVV